ncbi:hypothetical protein GCM10028857_00370 [Salinarchaeum chitinilyticum]
MTYGESRMPTWQRALSDRVAVDVVLAWLLAAATYLVVAIDAPATIRIGIGGSALFVLPGYVLVALLFPHRGPVAAPGRLSSLRGLDRVTARERVALSFGLSIAFLPVLGIAVAVSPWGFSETTVVGGLVAFVAIGGLLAALVRRRLPPQERFRIPLAGWAGELRAALVSGSPAERAVNVLVIASVIVALLTVGGVLAMPQDGQTFTNFAVLTENDEGQLVAGDYPAELAPNESASLVTTVENHEGTTTDYTVVVTLERNETAPGGNGSAAGSGRTVELDRYGASVEPGERWAHRHTLRPALSGSQLRVHYYLYRGDAPPEADAESAYRHLYFWLSTADGDA